MANFLKYQDKIYRVGDTISVEYKIKEGEKERLQPFKGILIKVRGNTPETKTFTVRKISKSGIGVERIFPYISPYINKISLIKKSTYRKAKLYFLQGLSDKKLRAKLYKSKS